jgi:hypothetical protein
VVGNTNQFLQGPSTNRDDIIEFNASLATGLPTKTKILNYRKSGDAFINDLSVVPLYDWLYKNNHQQPSNENLVNIDIMSGQDINTTTPTVNNDADDDDDIMSTIQRQEIHPSHFVALLKKTRNRKDIAPLTAEEIRIRDASMSERDVN